MLTDKTLQHNVTAELEWDPRLDSSHIGVIAEKGVVTLSGHVGSLAEKHAALAAVRRVKGVRALADEIDIRLPEDRKRHDDEIAKRAADILRWNLPEAADRIQIRVHHSIVTLEGTVDGHHQRSQAEHDITRLSGVAGVFNRLTVGPPGSPVDVKEAILSAFRRDAALESAHIHVTQQDGVIQLDGQVKSWHERDLAEMAAWAAPGVREVHNHLIVVP